MIFLHIWHNLYPHAPLTFLKKIFQLQNMQTKPHRNFRCGRSSISLHPWFPSKIAFVILSMEKSLHFQHDPESAARRLQTIRNTHFAVFVHAHRMVRKNLDLHDVSQMRLDIISELFKIFVKIGLCRNQNVSDPDRLVISDNTAQDREYFRLENRSAACACLNRYAWCRRAKYQSHPTACWTCQTKAFVWWTAARTCQDRCWYQVFAFRKQVKKANSGCSKISPRKRDSSLLSPKFPIRKRLFSHLITGCRPGRSFSVIGGCGQEPHPILQSSYKDHEADSRPIVQSNELTLILTFSLAHVCF